MKGKLKEFFELNPTQNTNKHKDFINYIDTASVENGVLTNIEFLSCNFPSRAQRIVKYDDILYSTVRPNLRHYYHYRKNYDHLVASTGFVLIRNKNAENYSTRFLFYYLSSNSVVKHLSNIAELSQSTFPSFSPKDLGKIDLPELTIEKQTKTASILSAYDDLIENNKKRIKILEQMAENLYKEWFVRFRFPGYETAEFENGIPKGWEIKCADTLFDITIGKTPNRKIFDYYCDRPINCKKWASITDIGNSEVYICDTKEYLTNEAVKNCKMIIVPKGSILLSFKLSVGKVGITDCEMCTNEAIAHFYINDDRMREYLFLFLRNFDYSKLGNTSSIGTAVNSKIVKKMEIMVPQKQLLQLFHIMLKPIFSEISLITKQNQNLIKQRDLLLPRLMSGKLEV